MPIEIKELHVRVAVTPSNNQSPGMPAPPGGASPEKAGDEMIAECVEQVLEILQNKRER